MSYRLHNNYYIPRRKSELLQLILPYWNGSKTELRHMPIKQLRAILNRIRQETLNELMRKKT